MPNCRQAALIMVSDSRATITNSPRVSFSPRTDQDIFAPPCTQSVTYVLIITCYLCPESGPPLRMYSSRACVLQFVLFRIISMPLSNSFHLCAFTNMSADTAKVDVWKTEPTGWVVRGS